MRWRILSKLLVLFGLSIGLIGASGGGCGGENLFEDLGDDGSRQAKLEAAQQALNKGECQAALNLFTELYGITPANVQERIDLAAARLCSAGFSPITLMDVAADFKASSILSTQLFNTISDRTITSLSSSWPTDVSIAKALLAQDPSVHPPIAYNNDPDAAFNLSIVVLVEGVLTVVDILNFANGVVDCAASQGSSAFTNCQVSATDATSIINGLQDASSVLTSLGLASGVTDSINTVLNDLRAVDNVPGDAIICADIVLYLNNQGMSGASCI